MKFVGVTFGSGSKVYYYHTKLDMIKGGVYNIVADNEKTYDSCVTVQEILYRDKANMNLRTITDATLMRGPRRPASPIKSVLFNKKKGVTTVVWTDGTITMVNQMTGDEWDEEKALAMCFMKKAYDNRGCFNEDVKKWCYHTETDNDGRSVSER